MLAAEGADRGALRETQAAAVSIAYGEGIGIESLRGREKSNTSTIFTNRF